MKPSGGLTAEDLKQPGVIALVDTWRSLSIFDDVHEDAFKIRDDLFEHLTRAIGIEGTNRGLSTRLARELGLTDAGMKSVKHRARTRRTRGDLVPDKRARAVLAAVSAAIEAYQEVMEGGGDGATS